MTPLRLTDTLTRRVADIHPANADGILRIYHCGPTVYASPHLGNLRRFLAADLLVRTARFLGYRVRSVMNITDVGHLLDSDPAGGRRHPPTRDEVPRGNPGQEAGGQDPTSLSQSFAGQDRMLVAAEREGKSPEEIAARYTQEFFVALASLRAEPADYYPRATMHIPQMQAIIRTLLEKGLAYESGSGVYFDVTKFTNYGKLSGNTLEGLSSGARVGVREEKRNPADFALWIKAPQEHRMQWDSPWGRGYPGWHIECSAMSMQVLGDRIDVHTGGTDNVFPHHENEIAQSDGTVGRPVVRIWVHNEHLTLDGAKMSKSDGEILTLADMINRGIDPLAFRLLCLQTHYRSRLNFSWEAMDAAQSGLKSLREFTRKLQEVSQREQAVGNRQQAVGERLSVPEQRFTEALADDLGSPQALAVLFDFIREINPTLQAGTLAAADVDSVRATVRKLDSVLALLDVDTALPSLTIPAEVQKLVEERETARQQKDFIASDRLRAEITTKGFSVEDTPHGPRVLKS